MKRKIFIIVGVIVVIAVIVILNLIQKRSGEKVEVELVKKGDIVSKVNASGELRAKAQVDISAETIGRIKRIYYEEGDYVKKGVLLIALDDIQVNANRKLAKSQLQQAEQDYSRAKKLFEKELISQENYEKAALSYASAHAQYEQALDAYQKTKIYAPIAGKIMKINVEEGETAVMGTMNYQGTVLMTVADLSSMVAVVRIDETDVPDVEIEQKVEIIADALPDSAYPGTVIKVGLMPITSQLSTEKVTDFEVEIELKEFSPLLRPGMNVKADIVTHEKKDVLVIPIQASGKRAIDEETRETVFLARAGKAELTEITSGVSSDTKLEIIDGLVEDDTVITGPYRVLSKLKDGNPVTYQVTEKDSLEQTSFRDKIFRSANNEI